MHTDIPSLVPGHRVVVHALGETPLEAVDQMMTLEPMDPPDPAALGPREVIIAVRAAAVGWVDLIMASGQYQHAPAPPYTPGLESAGVVAWVGPEVASEGAGAGADPDQRPRAVRPGDRVLVDGFLAGPRTSGPYRRWGGFASYVVAPVEAVRPIPGTLTFDQAAGLLSSYETAWHSLVARGRLQAGETVLIHGSAGATGLAAVEVAKLRGATVIATGRSDEKLAVVARAGADHVLRLGGDPPLPEAVKALTGGRGVDVVYDPVGGDLSLESLRCVRFGARFLVVGWAATPFVARGRGLRGAPNANQLPTNLIMMKGLEVLGCPTVIATLVDPSIRAPRLAEVLAWAEAGAIHPHVSHAFPLTAYKDALHAKWRGDVIGGCVVHP